jgi:hypothetical protein
MADTRLNRRAISNISFHPSALVVLLLAASPSASGGDISLAWNAVDNSALAGYMVYYGSAGGAYSGKIDVGNRTAYTVSGVPDGTAYHFAVTAYDATRAESHFSNDASGTAVANAGSAGNGAQAPTATVVEYFNDSLVHYFITSDSNEINALDSAVLPGWSRTGQTFEAYAASDAPPRGITPVCRFYGSPEAGLDSHFYSAAPSECDAVSSEFARAWVLESPHVFYVYLPDAGTGACPGRTLPVYRLYNERADTNHRYTTSLGIRQKMTDEGWIAEGYGPDAAVMCVPS